MTEFASQERRAPCYRLDLAAIARGFGITPVEAKSILENGRALAPFLEVLGRKLLGFPARRSTEVEDEYLIVVMRESVSFARSADKGVGRQSAALTTLTERIKNFHGIGIIDACRMPFLAFYEIEPTYLSKYLLDANSKSGNISRSEFISKFSYPINKEDFSRYSYKLDEEP
jgi:hypothetical protein